MTLALLLADITNPVVFGVVRGAERAAAAEGYTLVIAESQESGEAERAAALRIASSVDGVIFASSRLDTESLAELARIKPAVLINREAEGIASVVPDVDTGVIELVNHLRSLGHLDIGYVTGPTSSWIDRRRWDALQRHGSRVGLRPVEIPGGNPTVDGGASAFERVAASRVSAVIAFNDLMAIGLLRAAQEAGVRVPQQLSIAGFDDVFGSELTTPAITTIAAPLELAGAQAVDLLLAQISPELREGRALAPSSTRLLVRASTGHLATG
ncbi:MAG TPA: substrate-binding domain-containing protein [Pseudolysinimonas sp.]|nr:substrate-binding domain-containing protein [Pseudolysinimonas sp.]